MLTTLKSGTSSVRLPKIRIVTLLAPIICNSAAEAADI